MIFSQDSMLTVALRLVRGLALAWVLALTPGASALNSPQRPSTAPPGKSTAEYNSGPSHYRGPHTYLAMLGPAPLRFADAPPPLPPEPVLPKPKQPAIAPESAQASAQTPAGTTEPLTKLVMIAPESANDHTPEPTVNSPKPVSILPDDTKIQIRAEDVLPFFQFPGATESGAMSAPFSPTQPRGSTAPASSATYKQQ